MTAEPLSDGNGMPAYEPAASKRKRSLELFCPWERITYASSTGPSVPKRSTLMVPNRSFTRRSGGMKFVPSEGLRGSMTYTPESFDVRTERRPSLRVSTKNGFVILSRTDTAPAGLILSSSSLALSQA